MAISMDGIGRVCVTMKCDTNMTAGAPCYIDSEYYVKACSEEDVFFGIVDKVDGGLASVVIRGVVTVPYSGNIPGYGPTPLAADGQGGIGQYDDAKEYPILAIDRINHTVTILL